MPLFAGFRAKGQYDEGTKLLMAYSQIDNPDRAMDTLKRAIGCLLNATQLKPDFGFAWHNLGIAYYFSGYFLSQAANASQHLSAQEPGLDTALGEGSVGSYQNSLTALDQALKLLPDAADVHNTRGRTLVVLHRDEEAFDEFNIALELDPSYHKAAENKALLQDIKKMGG